MDVEFNDDLNMDLSNHFFYGDLNENEMLGMWN